MIDAPLAYAFGVGMVATFNPCGFVMLPAYLSYFLGLEGASEGARANLLRALAVGASMTAGFLVVFGVLGIVLDPILNTVVEKLPWVTIALGLVLVVLGAYLLTGRTFTMKLPQTAGAAVGSSARDRSGRRELWSVFVFGISFALVSLSCTISLFISVVTATASRTNFVSGVAVFIAYGLGMGLVLMVLTLAIALARQGFVGRLKRALPYINRISGGLLVLAGAYVAYYGWYELRVRTGNTSGGGPAQFVFDLNSRVSTWIQNTGPTRIGLVLALAVAMAVLAAVVRRSRTNGTAGD